RAAAVLAEQLLDVLRGLRRVVLVVLVDELERERPVADVNAALGIDLFEVRLPAAGDLGERRGQARLWIARRQLDDVALDRLRGIAAAVLGVDGRRTRGLPS